MITTQNDASILTNGHAEEFLRNLNPEQLLKDNKEKLVDANLQSMANERAGRTPIPDIADSLFNREPLVVTLSNKKQVTIRPMVVYDIDVFKILNSPFYRIIMGDEKDNNPDKVFSSDESEKYAFIWQFTHTPKEVRTLLKKGIEMYNDTVVEEIAFVYNPIDTATLLNAVMSHVFDVSIKKINVEAPNNTEANNSTESAVNEDAIKKKLNTEQPE